MKLSAVTLLSPTRAVLLGLLIALVACSGEDSTSAAEDPEAAQSGSGAAADNASAAPTEPVVDRRYREPPAGPVQGFISSAGALAWQGVPFAKPPVGTLRWRAPQPMAAWTETLDARAFGSPCVQLPVDMEGTGIDPDAPYGDEDCLYLNIYRPDTADNPDAPLPVMVWIHGGGNSIGEASQFDGSHLAIAQDVVVVTINYRLGPLGWFLHPDITGVGESEADRAGNYGNLDQVAALQWVRDNIASFGGDPGNVTIFGESAGGRNVITLLLSPVAEGLFHRAIAQSGYSYFPEAEVAEQLHPYSSSRVVNALVDSGKIASAAALRDYDAHALFAAYQGLSFGSLPVLDFPNTFRDGYVLPLDAGLQAFAKGSYNKVPVMLGTNRDEQKLFMFMEPGNVGKRLWFWQHLEDPEAYEREAYYMSLRWRITGAEAPARAIEAPVYVYRFDWDELATPLGMDFPAMIGAAHGLEMPFVLGEMSMGAFDQLLMTEENAAGRAQLTESMMRYWGNFARSGNPNLGAEVPTRWEPWAGTEQYIVFDTEADGGIRMSTDTTTFQSLMAQLKADERFETSEQRCSLFLTMSQALPPLLPWKKDLGC